MPPQDGAKRPTIYDVAREAGVATSTVSRALTKPGRVNEHTRERILEAAERLGYRANMLARALPSGRTQTLALVVSDLTNPHFFGIIRGAEQQSRAAGFTLIVGDTEESADLELRNIERLGPSVDGFIITASRMPDSRIRKLAAEHRLTLVSRQVEGVSSTVVDHVDGTRQIIEHLASLGHRSVVYLAGPRASWQATQRWRVVRAAAPTIGMTAVRRGPFPPSLQGGPAAADAAIGSGVTAAIAHNDLLAIGMLRRFAERGVGVPRDISVVGFDDIFGADICSPSLTTLAGPFNEVGRLAVDQLLGARGNPESRDSEHLVLPSHLVIRDSSGPAPGRARLDRPDGMPGRPGRSV